MKIVSFILVLLFSASVVPASAQIGPDGTGVVNGYFIRPNAILVFADLSGTDLSDALFIETDLSRAILSGATLDLGDILAVETTIWDTPDPRIAELEAQLAAMTAERDARPTQEQLAAVEAQRDARPTAEQLAAVEAERDARFTEDQIHAMSANPTVKINDAGNIQVDLSFIQSSDMENFAPFTVTPDLVSVVDGKICMEFPPTNQDTFFFRLGVE